MPLNGFAKIKTLFRSSVLGAVISGSRLLSGFARGKTTAIVLGAAGVGIYSQANQLSLFGLTLASLSMASGIINRMSFHQNSSQENSQKNVLSTAFTVQVGLCVLVCLFGIVFSHAISIAIFGSSDYQKNCVLVILSIPLSALASGYLQGLFVDSARYPSLVIASLYANFIGLAAFIPLVLKYGLDGAFIGLFINSLLLFICYGAQIRKHFRFRDLFRFGFHLEEFKVLMKFASVGLAMAAFSYGANLVIRSFVLRRLGAEANGLLQVPFALTSYYSPFLIDVLWIQLYPFVSKHRDGVSSQIELQSVLKYILTLQTAIAISILVGQEFLINLAYSRAFLGAIQLIPYQLLGDFFFFFIQVFSVYYLGASFFRINLIGWFLYYCVLTAVTVLTVGQNGIMMVPITYLGVNAVFAIFVIGAFTRKHRMASGLLITHGLACLVSLSVAVLIAHFHLHWSMRLIPFTLFGLYFYANFYQKRLPSL